MSIGNSVLELTSDTLLPGSDQNPSWKNVKGFQSGCKCIKGPEVLNVRSARKLKISHLYLFPCMFMMILYGPLYVSGKLPNYPSPKPTLKLGEGWVDSFPETYNDPL